MPINGYKKPFCDLLCKQNMTIVKSYPIKVDRYNPIKSSCHFFAIKINQQFQTYVLIKRLINFDSLFNLHNK
jgi:hypothetical protein